MRFSKSSNFYVFDGNFVLCFYANDEYWSVFGDPDFTDFPVAIVGSAFERYIWTDRVI